MSSQVVFTCCPSKCVYTFGSIYILAQLLKTWKSLTESFSLKPNLDHSHVLLKSQLQILNKIRLKLQDPASSESPGYGDIPSASSLSRLYCVCCLRTLVHYFTQADSGMPAPTECMAWVMGKVLNTLQVGLLPCDTFLAIYRISSQLSWKTLLGVSATPP